MAHDSLSSTFTGRVVSVNDRGLKLDGHTDWLNVSKFAPAFELPARGDTVTVCVDTKGFIRSLEHAPDGSGTTNGSNGAHNAPSAHHAAASSSAKDRTITRLAVLKAAAEFAASRDGLKSGDVLTIAASWERWVNRDDTPADPSASLGASLTDAF
jgi:hypothetical protein